MLPTPSTSHVHPDCVYEPAEDSFLMLDTLSSAAETQFFARRFGPSSVTDAQNRRITPSPVVVEVGTGSGVVLAFVTAHAKTIFGREDVLTIGTDINLLACQATKTTIVRAYKHNATTTSDSQEYSNPTSFLAALGADLTSPLRAGSVDVLIFNPPYVPSPGVPDLLGIRGEISMESSVPVNGTFERNSHLLSMSYEGGNDGMEVTNRLLEQLPHILNVDRGTAYILLCHQNRPNEVMQRIRKWGSTWSVASVGQSGKQAGWERLQIIRISRNQ